MALPKSKSGSQKGQKRHKGHPLQQAESRDKIVTCIPCIYTVGMSLKKNKG